MHSALALAAGVAACITELTLEGAKKAAQGDAGCGSSERGRAVVGEQVKVRPLGHRTGGMASGGGAWPAPVTCMGPMWGYTVGPLTPPPQVTAPDAKGKPGVYSAVVLQAPPEGSRMGPMHPCDSTPR